MVLTPSAPASAELQSQVERIQFAANGLQLRLSDHAEQLQGLAAAREAIEAAQAARTEQRHDLQEESGRLLQ